MYRFREVTINNGPHERKVIVIEFNNPDMAIVGEFLMSDAALVDASILFEIDQVLTGKQTYRESSGNRCGLEIEREKTLIYDLYEDFTDMDTYSPYVMNTIELRELIVIWLDKLAAFHNQ